jgi:two-component system response regulator HydG
MADPRLLIVEDDRAHAEALKAVLERESYVVEIADSFLAAQDRLGVRAFDMVLSDLRLGDGDGLELLAVLKEHHPRTSMILITGYGSIETAVEAMRLGAADYLAKPVSFDELRARVGRELEKRHLAEDNRELRAELHRRFRMQGVIGDSPPMRQVFELVRRAGPTDATVMILGESGTGKELVARSLHRMSRRNEDRFVAINCAALSETLIESELFGHAKGAFTGAETAKVGKFAFADGGTLFLDEIGDMALGTQAKLLRVLEDKEVIPVGANEPEKVDVRIIAATNRNLLERVHQGKFREDLFYRLAVVQIPLPGLRQRPEDIPDLVSYFTSQFEEQHNKQVRTIRPEVIEQLQNHVWPGNVRELRNVVETMVVLDVDGVLGLDDLPVMLRNLPRGLPPAGGTGQPAELPAGPDGDSAQSASADAEEAELAEAEIIPAHPASPRSTQIPADSSEVIEILPQGQVPGHPAHAVPTPPMPGHSPPPQQGPASLVGKRLEDVERELILATLEAVHGNRAQAAKTLGIGERTLYRKLKAYQAAEAADTPPESA